MYQGFKGCKPEKLLQLHRDGIEFLQGHLQTELVLHEDVASSMQQFIGRQLTFLFTRPWNILALPYRYAVTRFVRQNTTIEQQEEKGIINLDSLIHQARDAA